MLINQLRKNEIKYMHVHNKYNLLPEAANVVLLMTFCIGLLLFCFFGWQTAKVAKRSLEYGNIFVNFPQIFTTFERIVADDYLRSL